MQKTLVPFLMIIGVLFAVVGLAVLVAPTLFAAQLEMVVSSATAVADFRAVYGGVSLAIAGVAFLALKRGELRPGAVWMVVLVMDGLLLGRLISWATHGPGSVLIFAQMGLELSGAVWGALLLRESVAVPNEAPRRSSPRAA